jgi:hypothetical protein
MNTVPLGCAADQIKQQHAAEAYQWLSEVYALENQL